MAFFDSIAGIAIDTAPAPLLPNPPPRVFADQHHLRRLDAAPARDAVHRADDALRRAVQIELAVLPVGHRAARFHRMMAGGLHDERFVDDERGVLESGVEIAERPFFGGFAERHAAVLLFGEIFGRPLDRLDLWAGLLALRLCAERCRRAWRRRRPDVAFGARVRAARAQALDRIDHKRQRLEIDVDLLDRVGRSELVDGGDGEDRLARVERLVGERAFGAGRDREDRRR